MFSIFFSVFLHKKPFKNIYFHISSTIGKTCYTLFNENDIILSSAYYIKISRKIFVDCCKCAGLVFLWESWLVWHAFTIVCSLAKFLSLLFFILLLLLLNCSWFLYFSSNNNKSLSCWWSSSWLLFLSSLKHSTKLKILLLAC